MFILNMLVAVVFGFIMTVISVSNFAYSQDFDCTYTQITDTIGGITSDLKANSDVSLVVFVSNQDLTGLNIDGNAEIFLYDVNTDTFMQATDTTGDNNLSPTMSSDGSLVVFTSENDITGDNADGSREVFLLDTETLAIDQLTDTTGGGAFVSRFPIINSDGTHIAFVSNRDHTGENPDGNPEVFLFDIDTLSFIQITDTTVISHNLRAGISADGTMVSFQSLGDLTGANADLSQELYLYNANTDVITQVTDSTDSTVSSNRNPAFSPDGSLIVFDSNLDLTGDNPDGSLEIFLYDILADSTTQITMTNSNSNLPRFSPDGNTIIFASLADITGGNPGNSREIFLYDLGDDMFFQHTSSTGASTFSTALNADFTFLTSLNSSDLTGDNPDLNSEVFIAECLAVIQNIDNDSGGGGCSLAPSSGNISNLSFLMLFPALILIRRLIKRNYRAA
ncbi:MAG: hypothetical protein AAF462_08615 [Thermodesulfobacteriota bacterium]